MVVIAFTSDETWKEMLEQKKVNRKLIFWFLITMLLAILPWFFV